MALEKGERDAWNISSKHKAKGSETYEHRRILSRYPVAQRRAAAGDGHSSRGRSSSTKDNQELRHVSAVSLYFNSDVQLFSVSYVALELDARRGKWQSSRSRRLPGVEEQRAMSGSIMDTFRYLKRTKVVIGKTRRSEEAPDRLLGCSGCSSNCSS